MAFSLEGKVYVTLFAFYMDPAEHDKWAKIIAVADIGVGSQLSDENLLKRPSRFMAPENFKRLEAIRRTYDPTRRFHGFMGLTEEFKQLEA
jgi:FAD/FMN-containing dehydrogenase